MQLQELVGERELVLDALPARLAPAPELELVGAVVEPVSVQVVHALAFDQWTAEQHRHHEAVLKCLRGTARQVPERLRDHDPAVAVRDPASLAWWSHCAVSLRISEHAQATKVCPAQAVAVPAPTAGRD